MIRRSILLLFTLLFSSSQAADELNTSATRILAAHCLECHSGNEPKGTYDLTNRTSALKGGEKGKAIVPGKLAESSLWERVAQNEMPPEENGTLSDAEKVTLKKWIEAGAHYPVEPIDPFQFSTDKRAGYDWWSLLPLEASTIPKTSNDWVRNPIDAFVLDKLRDNSLAPSQAASPRVLVRRLCFDLIGLPPTPEQITNFENDPSEQALRKFVDELLGSEHYGERWGRHWLDVARFGESDGFERNMPREHQWHFRDWVIQALNSDMPYNQFAKLQIAGDYLIPGKAGLSSAAFLTAGVHNTVVGGSVFMKKTARQDELEEIAAAVGQTFVGLTINCARCHDHKFDPITQTEYYQFVSALNGVYHGDKDYHDPEALKQAESVKQQLAELKGRIESIDQPARQKVLDLRKQPGTEHEKPKPPTALFTWEFDTSLAETSNQLSGKAVGEVAFKDGAILVDGNSFVETGLIGQDIQAKTLEAVVSLSTLKQKGGGVISLQTPEGNVFDAIVYGERQDARWMAGSDTYKRSQNFSGPEETEAADRPVCIAIVYHEDGTIERYRDGKLYGTSYKTKPQKFSANKTVVRFGIRHAPREPGRMLKGKIYRAKLYDRALDAHEVAASAGVQSDYVSEEELVGVLDATVRASRKSLIDERDLAQAKLQKIDTSSRGKVFTVAARSQPGETHFLNRGNALEEGRVVQPGR